MRAYFFGDIHGNSYALERCLKEMTDTRVDEVYCIGDLVGWLPFGDRTLMKMRFLDFPTVAGNHDLLVAGAFRDHPEQTDRIQSTAYNAGLLSTIPGALDYLLSLPLVVERKDFILVHHSPFHLPQPGKRPIIDNFNYLNETALAESLMAWKSYPKQLIISGHDHIPAVYEIPEDIPSPRIGDVRIHRPGNSSLTISLSPHSRYWVKAGSVGGPYRDGHPVANAVVYDDSLGTITLLRLPYDLTRLRKELASNFFCSNLATIGRYVHLLDRAIASGVDFL